MKVFHFRLTFVAQKRPCLSSLFAFTACPRPTAVNDLINIRGVYLILGVQTGAFKTWGSVYSRNCKKLKKAKLLSAKISREFKNSGISTPSIDTYIGHLEIHIITLFQIPTAMLESLFTIILLPSLVYPHF